MKKNIPIDIIESNEAEAWFSIYNSYTNIIHYLISVYKIDENNSFLNKKFDEATKCYIKYINIRDKLVNKYCPNDKEKKWTINFINHTLEHIDE